MANPEHLKILKQGVKAWNKWREENPGIKPNLNRADLKGIDLEKANLAEADLSEANLRKVRLSHARLYKSILHGAEICQGDLRDSILSSADVARANLKGAKLDRVDLVDTNLFAANLGEASLIEAHLIRADLCNTYLEKANLLNSDLRYSSLVASKLTEAILTGAKLYGTARDGWIIKDIDCKYVYWDKDGKQRFPKDRDLEPGEFERLYAALPTIEYIFENGMSPIDPLIMDRVVKIIREKRPEFDIKIDSINARGLAPSIKFNVQHEEHKESALAEVQKGYEAKIAQLEAERDRYYRLVSRALDAPKEAKLIIVESGAIAALDGSTINIEHINYALELQKAIAKEPEESESFAKVAKKTALDIIGEAIKDIAKGQVKEAAKEIIELGRDLGPIITKTAAYTFFSNIC